MRAVGYLLWGFWRKLTALQWHRTFFINMLYSGSYMDTYLTLVALDFLVFSCFPSFLKTEMAQVIQTPGYLVKCRNPFIPLNQYHGCWWPGDVRSQGIRSHGANLVIPEYSGFSISYKERICESCYCALLRTLWDKFYFTQINVQSNMYPL